MPQAESVAHLLPFKIGKHGGVGFVKERNYPDTPMAKLLMASDRGEDYIDAVDLLNSEAFYAVEHCAANGITDARSLMRTYSMLANLGVVDNQRFLTERIVREFSRVHVAATDAISGEFARRGLCYNLGPAEWSASYTSDTKEPAEASATPIRAEGSALRT